MASRIHLPVLLTVAWLSACRSREPSREPAAESTAAVAATASAAGATDSVWYSRTRGIDLTNDGRADTVKLQAVGTQPDSLDVELTLIVGGEVKNRVAWGSSYELALADSATRASRGVGSLLRARLDSVLASVVVERLDAPAVRLPAEDSVVLAKLDPRPSHRVSFAYGYETVARMVWDAPRSRFVPLWSCC